MKKSNLKENLMKKNKKNKKNQKKRKEKCKKKRKHNHIKKWKFISNLTRRKNSRKSE